MAAPVVYKVGEHHAEPLVVEAGASRGVAWRLEAGAVLRATAFVLAAPDAIGAASGAFGMVSGAFGAADGVVADGGVADGGAAAASLTLTVDLAGEGAEFHLDALYVAGGEGAEAGRAAIDVTVNHLAPGCTSRQLIKGIAAGSATGTFKGLVHVAPGAQKTDATQRNQNLQLTERAQVNTRPGLEIYADDVRCSHGATVGRLDDEQIYYMRQRGVSEAEARRMQLQGFAGEIVSRCTSDSYRETVGARIAAIIDRL